MVRTLLYTLPEDMLRGSPRVDYVGSARLTYATFARYCDMMQAPGAWQARMGHVPQEKAPETVAVVRAF